MERSEATHDPRDVAPVEVHRRQNQFVVNPDAAAARSNHDKVGPALPIVAARARIGVEARHSGALHLLKDGAQEHAAAKLVHKVRLRHLRSGRLAQPAKHRRRRRRRRCPPAPCCALWNAVFFVVRVFGLCLSLLAR